MTTDTRQQIKQATRELHIDIEPHNRTVTVDLDIEQPGYYKVQFKNRKGDDTSVKIPMDAEYRSIVAMIREAWRATSA